MSYLTRKNLMNPKYQPKYPIYIVSKGRWESRLTAKALEAIKVPYYVVVEESEYEKYRQKMINIEDAKEIKELEAGLKKLENKKK